MKAGFTGTLKGMSENQQRLLRLLLLDLRPEELHLGLAIGADTEAEALVRELRQSHSLPTITVGHPGFEGKSHMTPKRGLLAPDVLLPAKEYLTRNHDIVDGVDVLFAAPSGVIELRRSGTWATIRYARKINRIVYLLQRST